jgi:hypothetical protein
VQAVAGFLAARRDAIAAAGGLAISLSGGVDSMVMRSLLAAASTQLHA